LQLDAKVSGFARPTSGGARTGLNVDDLRRDFLDNLYFLQARFPAVATANDNYMALAYTVRDRLLARWINTVQTYYRKASRTVCYFSAEYLPGPQLGANLVNLGIFEEAREAVASCGLDLEDLLAQEEEPGLGNGGLGRLAACFMDSLATLEIPAIGYGVRYEFGIFDQQIRDGWQVEATDKWLRLGNPWEVARPEIAFDVGFGGHTEAYHDANGRYRVRWLPETVVKGIAFDTPVLGYRVGTASMLRLWKSEAVESFDFQSFNVGDYYGAVDEKVRSENLTKVLYPNDEPAAGKQLRLEQQYLFVSCSLRDMIRIHLQRAPDVGGLASKYAVQLNDTHPAIAVAELMRVLVDEHDMEWAPAWELTRAMLAYTNHTLLPEALEKWPLALFGRLLPRHLEIIYEINHRFLEEVRTRYPQDAARLRRLSLIDEDGERYVRMAHLACVGSHRVNGVARLHSDLLTREVLRDFHELWPSKFTNVTNGVTPRRFMALFNPGLARLITEHIGEGWLTDLERLRALEPLAEDSAFRTAWRAAKLRVKTALAAHLRARTGVAADPSFLFDVQVKRIHEYKRQHLNVLHVVSRYLRLKRDPGLDLVPRMVLFAGKAAPGYFMAKLIIKLIHCVAEVVNGDPEVARRLRVAFLPDLSVKNGQRVYPAADLSEQISTAGKEASGTGNMKLSLNGALTIGTLDGANVEIREAVGAENFFLFGLTAEAAAKLRAEGYRPFDVYRSDPLLKDALDLIASGRFSRGDASLFRPLVDSLLGDDPYLVLADFAAYVDCQSSVDAAYRDTDRWTRTSILNVARMGRFSSDRAIREYCRDVWRVEPVPVELPDLPGAGGATSRDGLDLASPK
jgi:starch phosphorylase